MTADPHAQLTVMRKGPDPSAARLTVICVHGRGATASDILTVAHALALHDVAFLAPQAAGQTWYPRSFLSPAAENEPYLTSALGAIARLVDDLGRQSITPDRVALLGFSQGACLSLEFAARHARRYAAVIGLSGGVIGPPGTARAYPGSMAGTPVFLGCSDVDPHIPLARVHESADVFRALGATVDERIYPQMGHLVNEDEIDAARSLLSP
jgi:predicted esterase